MFPHLKFKGDIRKLTDLQARMLSKASGLVKPGGLLVYCVCSLQSDEGEKQVQKFLKGHPQFERAPIGAPELPWLPDAVTPDGDLRTLPSMTVGGARGMDGFYAARLRRKP